jgi:hypothetical protein
MLRRSASGVSTGTGSVPFSTGRLSPQQAPVRRDAVALLEEHHVPRHELVGAACHRRAIAQDAHLRHRQALERLDPAMGAVVLREPQCPVEDDDGEDQPHVTPAAVGRIDDADEPEHHDRAEEDEDERVQDLVDDEPPGRDAGLLHQAVQAEAPGPRIGLGGREAVPRRAKRAEQIVDRGGVGRRAGERPRGRVSHRRAIIVAEGHRREKGRLARGARPSRRETHRAVPTLPGRRARVPYRRATERPRAVPAHGNGSTEI